MPKIDELSPPQLEKFTLDLFETLLETFPKFDGESQRMLVEQANKYAEKLNEMIALDDKRPELEEFTFDKCLEFMDNLPLEEKKFFNTLDILIKTFRHAGVEERKIIGNRTYKFTMKLLNKLTNDNIKITVENK